MFALCAKGVYYYAADHPAREELLKVNGIVREIKLGGNGSATNLKIQTYHRINKYSSYYGKVWPGMEQINTGDNVNILAERNRLNKNELFEGKSFYIWELIHRGQTIIHYEGVLKLVQEKEAVINKYINYFLVTSSVLLVFALLRRYSDRE